MPDSLASKTAVGVSLLVVLGDNHFKSFKFLICYVLGGCSPPGGLTSAPLNAFLPVISHQRTRWRGHFICLYLIPSCFMEILTLKETRWTLTGYKMLSVEMWFGKVWALFVHLLTNFTSLPLCHNMLLLA